MKKFEPVIETIDDGLKCADVRSWAEQKYRLLGMYADIFTQGMRHKWSNLVYIDLYSGCGFSKIKNSNRILYGSPLIALSLPVPFSHYIFCDSDKENIEALRSRVNRLFPDKQVQFVVGDCNEKIHEIKSYIPSFSKENTVLSFCFVDPFSLDLKFATIRQLGDLAMDFLILLAFHMDANRNYKTYLKDGNTKIEEFLDNPNWRRDFAESKIDSNELFVQFLARQYSQNMVGLKYLSPKELHPIRSDDKNLPLYHLGFFSKHARGQDFWNEIKKYAVSQLGLGF